MFLLQNGRKFQDYKVNGKQIHIHNFHHLYGTKEQQPKLSEYVDYQFRFCVLRNPVKRLVSCFRNRVLDQKELENTKYKHLESSFEQFVEMLPEVCASVPSIKHHASPHWNFVGEDPAFYTNIYKFSEIEDLRKDLIEIAGRTVEFENTQSSNRATEITPSPATLKKIEEFYARDYELFGQYF